MSWSNGRLRTVFFGSPAFAVPALEALLGADHVCVPLVITQPDRPSGRGRTLRSPAVKQAADSKNVPVYQPETLRSPDAASRLQEAAPDVIVVVSYGEILRRNVLDLPPLGCLNVHPSLLPLYRGSLPIQAPILNGDRETGVSVIKLVSRMDAGPVLFQERVSLAGDETAGSLGEQLGDLAAARLPDVLLRWSRGEITPTEQDESRATYTRELTRADAEIDWSWTSEYIERFVRAMYPWTRAWSAIGDTRLTIDQVSVLSGNFNVHDRPGAVFAESGDVLVSTGDGLIRLDQVQPAGKKSMSAGDWFRGVQSPNAIRFEVVQQERKPLIFTRD